MADTAGLREMNDLVAGIGLQRGVEASVFFRPHSQFYLWVHIVSVKNVDVVLYVHPLPEVFVPQ